MMTILLNAPMSSLKKIASSFKREFHTYRLVLKDRRTPRLAKILLGAAVGYTLMPFDLIPDFIPIIGHIDDIIIVPLLIFLALKMVPPDLVDDCRKQAESNYVG